VASVLPLDFASFVGNMISHAPFAQQLRDSCHVPSRKSAARVMNRELSTSRPSQELDTGKNFKEVKMGNYYNRNDDEDRYREWLRSRGQDERGVGYSGGDESDYYARGRGVGYNGMDDWDRRWQSRLERNRNYARESRYPNDYEYESSERRRASSRDLQSRFDSPYGAEPATTNRYYERTYRPPYYGRDFDSHAENRRNYGERGWWDRASDEVASWFGDEEAERRRSLDEARKGSQRGRGPRDYRRSDERIREDINDRLTDHEYLDAYDIQAAVSDGEVTLSGTVNTRRDKRLAEDLADSVSGVKNVQNQLRVGQVARVEEKNVTTGQAYAARQK
jgi:osmotically-inducible protein OsmY